ncbi:maltose alpha-D-glucosyltransferase [Elioraea sp.]|uniref:maltose alpha-D-glucosyltransferase n=1 Tax=Elioraea sp. TaxID=2185103 RepID=UPI0025B85C80|nr:maltose alpha-D-glucosyltransferase [Elioraea sp.]
MPGTLRPATSVAATADDPLWYKDAVLYQVHVKSFYDSNEDGIGDFAGLIARLDYIASLGITAIWLLPFYPSPRRDDGYDIADYVAVHPDYGTLRDVRRFIDAAHARGLRVITELVINHTSDQHPWFQRARLAPKGSWQRDFYVWRDDDKGFSDTRIIFIDTETSNWAWDDVAKAYYWHRFYSHQPDLNFDNPRVLRAVMDALHFWMKAGVDGLRLDAVPYLVEREGTNNENLPETHDVIRRIRAELDAHYPGRMLLAEANQWPEDTQLYFGQGDECHMAFHFPLMPRMYMALAQEDRYPITDILRQTPPIPEPCQWAIFLRNHDELTLEMVTDSERDVLWRTYAADPRARLNLGIRRRLAPLLDHDRRRIELLNALLLSMPGTPVIYYGDEIGMGDNIFLGDRDGVRTPMQWSPDRQGGFSRADPARLVLPPIMDAVYGYQAVNVEAQSRDPHSLLNWTRRMLSVRQDRAATFGRGTYRPLYPANRTILAYLRQHVGDTVLCVANLSRSAQAVELDLADFQGRVPVEMLGRSAFPPIGALPYLLTLPPYGFFWFVLDEAQAPPAWHKVSPAMLPELVTFVLREGLRPAFAQEARALFEEQVLPSYLPLRPWFGPVSAKPRAVRVVAAPALRTADGDVVLVELAGERAGEQYFLPLALVFDGDERANALAAQLALARARRGRRVGLVTDGFAIDAFAHSMVAALAEGRVIVDEAGEVRFRPAPGLAAALPGEGAAVHRVGLALTQSSLLVGETIVLKLVRRSRPGSHPEIAMIRHLTEKGFAATPTFLGDVVRVGGDGSERVLAFAQGFVRNQGNGRDWTLAQLRRVFDDALVADPPQPATVLLASHGAPSLTFMGALGRHLGEMHAVLAAPDDDPAFAPAPVTDDASTAWAVEAATILAATLDRLGANLGALGEADAAMARAVLAARGPLLARLRRPLPGRKAGLSIRVHGALDMTRTLVVAGDAALVGFGSTHPAQHGLRAALTSPARDLATLACSLDALVAAALSDLPPPRAGVEDPRPALAAAWREAARTAISEGYRAGTAGTALLPAAAADEAKLLLLFTTAEAAAQLSAALDGGDRIAASAALATLARLVLRETAS